MCSLFLVVWGWVFGFGFGFGLFDVDITTIKADVLLVQ